jgi:FixJ family two-component response regulator
LILDLKLADVDGFAVLAALSEFASAPPVIIMTAHADPPNVVRAYRQGIVAFLQKQSFSESDLWDAVHRSFSLDEARRAADLNRQQARSLLVRLTSGERRVAELVLEGRDHGQIAELLSISRRTVESRMARVKQKLGIASLPELVVFFARAAAIDD